MNHEGEKKEGFIEKVIEWSAHNKFIIFTFTAFALIYGIYVLGRLPLDAIPDLSDVQVIVYTEWKGRSPDLVEDQVTYPIVTALLAVPKVKVVRGYSFFGFSFVYVIFQDGTDIYWARSRVLEYLQQVQGNLPEGVTPQLGPDATGVGWGFEYVLVDRSGKHDLAELRTFQDWYLKYWLESVPGVAEVATVGGYVKQYQVEIDPNALLAYRIPLERVINAIRNSNNDVGGRVVEFSGTEYFVRGRGYIKSVKDIENIVVAHTADGTPVLIKDIGYVHLGPDIRRGTADFNGEGNVVGGIVVIRFGENVYEVIQRVKEKIAELKDSLPEGVKLIPVYDRSDLIRRAVHTLYEKLLEESIIVSLVCIIFLYHIPSALVAIIMLPLAVLFAIVLMYEFHITANIMSLGGIAIAIGAMVDAAIVMIENAHKYIEHEEGRKPRSEIIIEAAKLVGRPLFFSLLVITVSFLPIFALEAQEGRLFKPLAYTKTFSMFFASLLSVTIVPPLMMLFIRGKITSEEKNPISKFLIKVYRPACDFVIRRRWYVIGSSVVIFAGSMFIFKLIGSEFMPPLNEGSILYMPTTLPGISITEAERLLLIQDRLFKTFPEVDTVFGKVGRANTPTDPAPLSMIETTVMLKPEKEWPCRISKTYSWAPGFLRPALKFIFGSCRKITWEELINEMDARFQFPGVTNAWTMPIKARIDMLTTGIRTPVGIKIYGPDLKVIQHIGEQIEGTLKNLPGTRSVYAERVVGGYFLDFTVRRKEAARYGLTVEQVENIVETAIGGKNIDMTVEGRERYPINIRYPRELRDSIEELKRVLVWTPTGAHVPIGQLADIRITTGPPVIKDENGSLTGWVYVDVVGRDIGSYVEDAKKVVRERVKLPPGYHLEWSGQYEYMKRAKEKLQLILPFTLLIVFMLLYFNKKNITETLIVLLAVPFSLVGVAWTLWLLGYNLSVAVWVGIIALLGVDAETGVVMLIYLDEAYERWKKEGRMKSFKDLEECVMYGAVQRIRPKIMTVSAIIAGLLPIMWSHGTGADVMKRIAAPMIGGIITSAIMELLVYPAVYTIWKWREVRVEQNL